MARALAWSSLGLDWPPQPRVKVVIEASDPAGAQQLRAALTSIVDLLEKRPEVQKQLTQFADIRKLLDWKVNGTTLSLELDDREGKLSAIARDVIQPTLEAAAMTKAFSQAVDQLKHLAIAMHNYHDQNKSFPPPAIVNKEGKPLLSWRVALLPFLEEGVDPNLYGQFHLDEPWDSAHNKTLIAKMPDLYRCPMSKVGDMGRTVYLAPRGEATMFPGPAGIRIRDVTDGTSKTIMLVAVDEEHAVPWTKPEDWTLDPEHPAAGLGAPFFDKLLLLFGDGSVHMVHDTIDKDILRKLLTRNGSDDVTLPDD